MELANRVCLIVGASGAIGSAVAQRFCAEGAHVVTTYLSKPASFRRPGIGDNRELEFELDVCSYEQTQIVLRKVVDEFGRIDALVNCAGVIGPIGPTQDIDIEDWVRAVEVNLIGSFCLTRSVLPFMLAQSRGKIIHFSGGGAAYARPFCTAYAASKAALVRFVESLAAELRHSHIEVNAIAPGPVYSRMWEEMRAAGQKGGDNNLQELKKMEETGGVPADRAADLSVFLASDRSNGLSGRLISAVHDDWTTLEARIADVMNSERGTLRRVPFD